MAAAHPRPNRPWAHVTGLGALLSVAVLASAPMSALAQVLLPGHSIGAPPEATTPPQEYLTTLDRNWFLAGTVIPSTKSLVLSPGVPNRLGFLWSRSPLLTNDFEVSFEFSSKPPDARSVEEDGFALWYVHENVSDYMENFTTTHLHSQSEIIANTWGTAFAAEGLDLFGYKSKFDGVGVFFSHGAEKTENGKRQWGWDEPKVGAVANDGQKAYKIGDGIPASDAVKYDYHTGQKVTAKIRFSPKGVKVSIVGGPSQEIKMDVKPGGYIGFSVYGGTKGIVASTERSDFLEMWKLDVTNHDSAGAKGEAIPTAPPVPETTKAPEEKSDIMHDMSSHKDHRAESEAIKELTNMVFKLVVESQPVRNQMVRAIESLGKRVTVLEKTFEGLKVELDRRTGHKLGEEFEAIKKELTSLSNVATTETQERHKKLQSLHEDIAHVHKSATSQDNIDHHLNKLTESNQRTLENLTTSHQKMFGVSIAAIAFIVIAGLSLYNKFRCWEKKHIL